ncbi:MAG TPA: DUF4403 family protein [Cyclobacteriaceae bacterium]|jgi:hypothetical protein|nr:DUF4403 family protein [Cyclobacteriaceae bacterium]
MIARTASFSFIVLMMLMLLNACERIRPKPPQATNIDSTLTIPLSTINIPIDYEVAKLEEMINTKIKGVFLDQWLKLNNKGDSLYLQLEKRSDIKLSWDKKTLSYSLPLNVSAKFKKSIAGIRLKNSEPIKTQLTLYVSSQIELDNRWNLKTKSTIKKINWISDPQLNLAFIKVNLRKIVENMIEKNEDKLLSKLDNALGNVVDMRKVVSKIWMDLQKPIRINKKGLQIWLKAEAQNMSARFVDKDPELITLEVELKAFVQTILEHETVPASNAILPPFKRKDNDSTGLTIFVLSKIPFEVVNEILNRELDGKALAAKGYSTTIKKIDVYGTAKGLAIKLKVRGDLDGQLYVTATPGYDTLKARLFANHFSFDIDSENALLNSADWLLHDDALDTIKKVLVVDLKPYVDALPFLIVQAVDRGKVGEKIDLTIDELDLKPLQYIITKRNFQIMFEAEGKASISLKAKVFAGKKEKVNQR